MLRKQSTLVTDAETETRKNRNEWCNRTIYLSFKERFIKIHKISKYNTPYPYRTDYFQKHEHLGNKFQQQSLAADVSLISTGTCIFKSKQQKEKKADCEFKFGKNFQNSGRIPFGCEMHESSEKSFGFQ